MERRSGVGAWHERGEVNLSEGGLLGLDLDDTSQLVDPRGCSGGAAVEDKWREGTLLCP